MPDTLLILHVKGTEADTAQLSREAIREGIADGKITQSQLIWVAGENTWKQVRELPELLPGETLILHVKGTESETQQLPKQAVRTGISEGKITHSQLIWIPNENSWKPVRELPDLLPGETLILHVKGTEAETQELPKQAVQAGVSRGQITHSQLIWIPNEHTWKPVRELPDLLPGERLILHVKGTEAETTELPRQAIRTALSKGQITHSQLIWSPNEHSWKQVREIPELLPSQKLAPAPAREVAQVVPRIVDGIIPESPNGLVARAVASAADVPRVRVATAAGSPPKVHASMVAGADVPQARAVAGSPPKVHAAMAATAVPQVRVAETPPADEAQAPTVVAAAAPQVRVAAVAATEAPRVRVAAAATETPQVRVKATATPAVGKAKSVPAQVAPSLKIDDDSGSHPLKWLCIGLGGFIVFILGINYLLVDQPLSSNLGQTKYPDVTVYSHLGAFMQPNVLVIHVRPSTTLNRENLADFLTVLAHSTPENPLTRDVYARVALTSGWTAQYSFSGFSWKQLGDMQHDPEDQRKDFLMSQMGDASGQSILGESTLNEAAQRAKREIAWGAFVHQFAAGH